MHTKKIMKRKTRSQKRKLIATLEKKVAATDKYIGIKTLWTSEHAYQHSTLTMKCPPLPFESNFHPHMTYSTHSHSPLHLFPLSTSWHTLWHASYVRIYAWLRAWMRANKYYTCLFIFQKRHAVQGRARVTNSRFEEDEAVLEMWTTRTRAQ